MRRKINLTVATDIRGKGGIATVLNVMKDNDFFIRWNTILISTHSQSKNGFQLNKLSTFFIALVKIVYFHARYHVEVVHVHMSSRWSYIRKTIIIHLVKSIGSKVILHLHGSEFKQFYEQECTDNQKKGIQKTFNMSDIIIVLSSQWHDWLSSIVDKSYKIKVIHNCVSIPNVNRDRCRKQLLLFLGRLGYRKGVGDLIDAFSVVADEFPSSYLVLAGDGDVTEYQQQAKILKLEKRIEFVGWVSGDVKISWLEKADIYILPSYNEGFPMGILEAMSASVAVIASTSGGIPDAITNGTDGVLVNAGDIRALTSALRLLLSNKQLKDRYTKNARKKYLQNFSPEAIFPQLDDIYTELLKDRN